LQPLCEG
jgi:hypothetical protein